MATLSDTTIDDTGYLNLPAGTTAQRPATPSTGMWRWNTTEGCEEYYNGVQWKQIVKPDGTSAAKAATNATALLSYQTTSGYYWIKPPNAPSAYYVYCDQTNYGGGWMLMMNVNGSYRTHVTQNTGIYDTVSSNSTVSINTAGTYRWSTTEINYFLNQSGNKVMWIEPRRANYTTTDGSNKQWFIPIGTQAQPLWPSDLQCSTGNFTSNANISWVYKGCGSYTDARDGINISTGSYTGGDHYAPTLYPAGQSFFGAGSTPSTGIRFTSPYNSVNGLVDGNPGQLWLKIF